MELNEEQKRDEKLSHQRAMEYEMNMIIEMLDIKRWIWPSMAMDEIDIPKDAPLGQYSPELLAQYINANENMEVEVDYYYGGFRPDICYETVQIYKINKDGKQYRIGYVIWGYNGYDVESNRFERRDETGHKARGGNNICKCHPDTFVKKKSHVFWRRAGLLPFQCFSVNQPKPCQGHRRYVVFVYRYIIIFHILSPFPATV